MADLDSLIGCKISLISHQDVRYDGTLFSINQTESSLVLKDVQSFGTENRVTDPTKAMAASPQVISFVTFPGHEIKDLYVHDDSAPPSAPPAATVAAPVAPAPAAPVADKPKHEAKPRQHHQKTESAHPPRAPHEKTERKPVSHAPAVTVPAAAAAPAAKPAAAPKQHTQQQPSHNVGTGSHLLKLREKKSADVSSQLIETQGEFNFEAGLKTFNKDEVHSEVPADAAQHKYVKDDFFDNFSSGAKEDGKKNRLTSSEERQLNQDTFGAIALTGGYRRGGRGRGRGGYHTGGNTVSGGRGGRGYGGQGRGRGGAPRSAPAAQA